jgi:hypothetical protein
MKLRDWKAAAVLLLLCAVGVYIWIGKADVQKASAKEPVFRDLYWGEPPEKLGERRLEREPWHEGASPPTRVFMKQDESLRLGSLRLKYINYLFDNDNLCEIRVYADKKDYEILVAAADEKYGNAVCKEKRADDAYYAGIGDTTTACLIHRYHGSAVMVLFDTGQTFEDLMQQSLEEVRKEKQDIKDIADSW